MADTDTHVVPSMNDSAEFDSSTRASTSPLKSSVEGTYGQEKSSEAVLEASPGVLSDDVYDAALSWWGAIIRRLLVRILRTQSDWIAAMQVSCY
jgi:hypothetical protein